MTCADYVHFDGEIVAEKVDWEAVVGGDAADLGRSMNHNLGPVRLKPTQRRLLLG